MGASRRGGRVGTIPEPEGGFYRNCLENHNYHHSDSETYHHPYYHHDNRYHDADDSSSDDSELEIEELPAGTFPVRGSRGGYIRSAGRRGRGDVRSNTGEGTSRGPGELGSNFNSSKYDTKQPIPKQTNKQQSNKQTFAGQAEAIVRSAAATTACQDDEFPDDPVFNAFLCADGSDSNVGTVGRRNPGWLLSQYS